jgi:hypothetical protein
METTYAPTGRSRPPVPRQPIDEQPIEGSPIEGAPPSDAAQEFVARLRAAARSFAAAAGAQTAVVREAVPPARHRRSRCRVVLRDAGGTETDLTFLGPAGSAATAPLAFSEQIQGWLAAGGPRSRRWLVVDADAADGTAIDVAAWSALL